MKNIKLIVTGIFILFLSVGIMAQTDPPDPPADHGGDVDVPGRAPISGGVLILLTAGLAYGGKKVYNLVKENEAEPLA